MSKKKKATEKDPAAVSLGQRGGQKRMAGLSKAEKSELGKAAARIRWGKPGRAKAAKRRAGR